MADDGGTAPSREVMRAAWGGGVKMVGATAAGVGGLAIALLLTRTFGPEAFGLYSLGLVTAEILTQVSELGLRSSILRFTPIAHRRGQRKRLVGIFRVTTGLPLLVGLVLALSTLMGADVLALRVFDSPDLAPVLRAFALAIPISALAHSMETFLRGVHRADLSILGMDVGLHVPRLILTAGAVAIGAGVVGASFSHVIAMAVSAIVLRHLIRPFLVGPGADGVPSSTAEYPFRELWAQALPMYLTRMLQAFGGRLETLVLGIYGLTSGVGIFAAALQLTRIPEVLRRSLTSVTQPLVSDGFDQGGRDGFAPLVHSVSRWSTTITLPFFVIAALFANPLLAIFGEEFRAGAAGLVLLAAIPLLDALVGLCTSVLAMTGNARLNTFNSFTFLVAKIALDVWLIPAWGLTGAAAAAFLASALLSALRVAETYWLFRMLPVDATIIKVLIAGSVGVLAGVGVRHAFPDQEEALAAVFGASTVVAAYAAALLSLGLAREDRLLLGVVAKRLRGGSANTERD